MTPTFLAGFNPLAALFAAIAAAWAWYKAATTYNPDDDEDPGRNL